jgi:Flp pilus assembly protein TadG
MKRFALITNVAGSSAVEFAIIAPVFFGFLFSLVEGGRMVWTNQALSEAAYSTVRCRTVKAAACETDEKQIQYAVARARSNGITVDPASVSIQADVPCRGVPGSVQVTIQKTFGSPVKGFVPMPDTLTGKACYPTL